MDTFTLLLQQIYESDNVWKLSWDVWYEKWKKNSHTYNQTHTKKNIDVRNEQLSLLITYGDSLTESSSEVPIKPLSTLYKFLDEMCDSTISGVHILPYFPYTSDDGFSISDYRQVRNDLGDWDDIKKISNEYYFMTDLVVNHCSSKHSWFKKFLNSISPFDKYFITGNPTDDYSMVVRPRPHFILSEYDTTNEKKHVWTTFSRDQVDLNFANPEVLFEMLDTLLEYVLIHNSKLIRLDAVAYLWKEMGTSCIHHYNTHLVVKLMRALLEEFAPNTIIITETNVPHEENISYFGNKDEAQMVYQFPLPPLLLYSMITENSSHLQQWASKILQPTDHISYFNFCASHDGIGITPTHGILNNKECEKMIEVVKQRGGLVSYKSTPKGKIPYELNVNYLSAVAPSELPYQERAKIFLVSQSVMLAMPGVPGIYIHSLLGSENWNHGVKETGQNRTINRQSLHYETIVDEINKEGNLRNEVFNGYLKLLQARKKTRAFKPSSPMQVIKVKEVLFAIIRDGSTKDTFEKVLCLVNLSSKEIVQEFALDILPWMDGGEDLLSGDIVFCSYRKDKTGHSIVEIPVKPYEIIWLRYSSALDIS